MYHDFNYEATLASSIRAAWQIEDVLPEGSQLDFRRDFLPEGLARTGAALVIDADAITATFE